MNAISLNGKWRMTGGGFDCYGTVPGSMYSFLLENSLIPDPFYRDNEYERFMREVTLFTVSGKNPHDDAPDSLAMLEDFRNNGVKSVTVARRLF